MRFAPSRHQAAPESDEPEDLFIIAYDEYLAAVDRTDALAKECEAIAAAMPDCDKRNPRALLGAQSDGEQTTAIFANSHEEIDQAMERMLMAPGLGETTDLSVIQSFRAAAHAAFDLDATLLESARVRSGLDDALTCHRAAMEDAREARDRMLAIVPISPEGIVWLSRYVHTAANEEQDIELAAKAARNLALATSRKVFGRDLLPTLH